MINFISKYKQVVEHYKLDNHDLFDVASALCIADQNWGTNDKKLDINRLIKSVDVFGKVTDRHCAKLPDIQIKRVLNDALLIGIKMSGKDLPENVHLSSKAAEKVAYICGVSGLGALDYYDDAKALEIMEKLYCSINQASINEFKEQILKYIMSQIRITPELYNQFKSVNFSSIQSALADILHICYRYLITIDFSLAMGIKTRSDLIYSSSNSGKYKVYISDSDYNKLKNNTTSYNAINGVFSFSGASEAITIEATAYLIFACFGNDKVLLKDSMKIRRLAEYGNNQ